jgi:hypothetical protein
MYLSEFGTMVVALMSHPALGREPICTWNAKSTWRDIGIESEIRFEAEISQTNNPNWRCDAGANHHAYEACTRHDYFLETLPRPAPYAIQNCCRMTTVTAIPARRP